MFRIEDDVTMTVQDAPVLETNDDYEAEDDFQAEAKPKRKNGARSWWRSIIGAIWQSPEERAKDQRARLHELNAAVDENPGSPTNYVLRGELFMEMEQYHLAAEDFDTAWELAAEQVETADWGLVAQGMMDRAQQGWDAAQRKLGR